MGALRKRARLAQIKISTGALGGPGQQPRGFAEADTVDDVWGFYDLAFARANHDPTKRINAFDKLHVGALEVSVLRRKVQFVHTPRHILRSVQFVLQ
jgi:hypothetical protein